MKKVFLIIISFAVLLLLSACAANTEESKTIVPTGYAAGQVQRPCVFYQGILWVAKDSGRWDYSTLKKDLTETGQIKALNNNKVPSEELAAAHIDVGTKLFLCQSGGEDRLFYQLDNKHVWELEIYTYPPESLGPVN